MELSIKYIKIYITSWPISLKICGENRQTNNFLVKERKETIIGEKKQQKKCTKLLFLWLLQQIIRGGWGGDKSNEFFKNHNFLFGGKRFFFFFKSDRVGEGGGVFHKKWTKNRTFLTSNFYLKVKFLFFLGGYLYICCSSILSPAASPNGVLIGWNRSKIKFQICYTKNIPKSHSSF